MLSSMSACGHVFNCPYCPGILMASMILQYGNEHWCSGLMSRVSLLRPWWHISEWGLVQQFSSCRQSAHRLREEERGRGERQESLLSLTLLMLLLTFFSVLYLVTWLMMITQDFWIFPKICPFFFSYYFSYTMRDEVYMNTQFSAKDRHILVISHEWYLHFWVSLSLSHQFEMEQGLIGKRQCHKFSNIWINMWWHI